MNALAVVLLVVEAELAWLRNGVETPQQLAATRIERTHGAGRLDGAHFVGQRGAHYYNVADDGGRRSKGSLRNK